MSRNRGSMASRGCGSQEVVVRQDVWKCQRCDAMRDVFFLVVRGTADNLGINNRSRVQ